MRHSLLMKTMKLNPILIGSLLSAFILLGCRPERLQTAAVNPRTMAFNEAGVSVVLGEEWQWQNAPSQGSLYPPTLVSQSGRIRVLLLPPDRSDPAVVAEGLRAAFDANPQVAKHSFRKQQFATDKGARGLCVSYLQREKANGLEATVENSHYLVRNRAGRCVVINYLASADNIDTSSLHRMLRTSLSLQ
jgi:hypothetical protein